MMEKIYSDLQLTHKIQNDAMNEYQKKLTVLKKQIHSKWNWKILQKKFEPFILLLISLRDKYNIYKFK